MPRFVDIETPYAGKSEEQISRNLLYARACFRDSLMRGEIPFASHLLFTQPGILDDTVEKEREMGINAGKDLIESLPGIVTVVYRDLGISRGMRFGIAQAEKNSRAVEYRTLGEGWEEKELDIARNHSHAILWGFNGKK